MEPDLTRRLAELARAGGGDAAEAAALLQRQDDVVAGLAALEERLATVEDALDGLAERFEAVVRDGEGTTNERYDLLATAVRDSLRDLGAAVDRSLASLGASVGGALAELTRGVARLEEAAGETRGAVTAEVSSLRVDLADALDEAVEDVTRLSRESVTAAREALEAQTEALRGLAERLRAAPPGTTG